MEDLRGDTPAPESREQRIARVLHTTGEVMKSGGMSLIFPEAVDRRQSMTAERAAQLRSESRLFRIGEVLRTGGMSLILKPDKLYPSEQEPGTDGNNQNR